MSVIVTLKGQKRYLSCCYLRFCAYSATITDMNFRIRIFNFCTSNCTPWLFALSRQKSTTVMPAPPNCTCSSA